MNTATVEPNGFEELIISNPYLVIFAVIIAGVTGVLIMFLLYKKKFGDVDRKISLMIADAKKEADIIRKEAEIEKKDIVFKARSDIDRETSSRRSELNAIEKRLLGKEELLEKKYLHVEKRENDIRTKEDKISEKERDIARLKEDMQKITEEKKNQLLSIARLSEDEARRNVLKMLEDELETERANLIRKSENDAKLIADKKARNIIVLAIQRQAIDQCQEHSTRSIPIPNDEMKGRIIGRDGRNIRAFEQACGVDIIVDDTPDAILISCFDPIRKHIAKVSLERLMVDGRIHPARIEEVVNKVRRETGTAIRDAGEGAVAELGIASVHPELVKLIGQLQFRYSYGQQQLQHSVEVAQIAGLMAGELGMDVKLAKRAGLLHDIGKAVTHEIEGSHAMIGADLCKKYGEVPDVEHAVRAHHQDVEPKTVYAFIIDAADAISGGRPGARSKTEVSYIQRLEKLEEICMSFRGVQRSYAVQAGRDVRILVDPQKLSDQQAVLLARDISRRIMDEMQFPGQIKVSVIREYRAIEYAQ